MSAHKQLMLAGAIVVSMLAASCSTDPTTEPSPEATISPPTTTTSTPAPTTTVVTSLSAEALCNASLVSPREIIASESLNEISGIAASRQHPGVTWTHNDSGGQARLHAVDADGADLGSWTLFDAIAFDWEDISLASGTDGEPALIVADFGDNFAVRSDIRMYRVKEPTDLATPAALDVESFVLRYPEGAQDAEAFLVDPLTSELVVITKGWNDDPIRIYTASASAAGAGLTDLVLAGEADLGGAGPLTTAADISADGSVIAIRTYLEVLMWDRSPDESVADALSRPPCQATVELEPQGEAIAFLPSGRGYLTISEGLNPLINTFVVAE